MRTLRRNAWMPVLCLSLLDAHPAWALDYSAQASSTFRQTYTSNLFLAQDSPKDIWGSSFDVQANALARAATWSVSGSAHLDNWLFYPSFPQVELDMQNQYLEGQINYFSERSHWNLDIDYTNDALLSSSADPTLGIIRGRVLRESLTLAPSWNYQLNEYTKLSLSYSFNDSKYPANSLNQTGLYPSSNTHSLSASASHKLSQKLALTGMVSAAVYSTLPVTSVFSSAFKQSSDREIRYLNIHIGLKYQLFDDLDLSFSGGAQLSQTILNRSSQFFTVVSSETTRGEIQFGPLFNVGINKKFDQTTISLDYGHQISPTLNGQLNTADRVALNASHKLNEHFNASISTSYNNSSFPSLASLSGSGIEQDFVNLGADLSYMPIKPLTVNASYSYQMRAITTTDNASARQNETQDSHGISISLRYDFEQLHY